VRQLPLIEQLNLTRMTIKSVLIALSSVYSGSLKMPVQYCCIAGLFVAISVAMLLSAFVPVCAGMICRSLTVAGQLLELVCVHFTVNI
jgi:hypothetical protein